VIGLSAQPCPYKRITFRRVVEVGHCTSLTLLDLRVLENSIGQRAEASPLRGCGRGAQYFSASLLAPSFAGGMQWELY
jgi:hypothetical protein